MELSKRLKEQKARENELQSTKLESPISDSMKSEESDIDSSDGNNYTDSTDNESDKMSVNLVDNRHKKHSVKKQKKPKTSNGQSRIKHLLVALADMI